MKFQTIESKEREAFNSLGGCWILIESDYGCRTYQNALNDDIMHVFKNEHIKGYGLKKNGMMI